MVPVARRMIWREKIRFSITAAGLGLTTMLMMFLLGVYEGVKRGGTGYVRDSRAAIWVCENNSTNLLRSSSFIPARLEEGFKTTNAVESVSGVLRTLVTTRIHGKPVTLFVFGFDPKESMGRPSRILGGTSEIRPGELIVDKAFAAKYKLGLGDSIVLKGRDFRIAGICTGTNAVVTQFVFATLEDTQKMLGFGGVVSFYLLSLRSGHPPESVIPMLKRDYPAYSFFSRKEFIQNNLDELKTGVLPIFWTVALLGEIVGAAIIALMLYGSILEKREDYALLKALGAPKKYLLGLIFRQSGIAAFSGFLAGVALNALLSPVLLALVPELSVAVTPESVLIVLAASLLIAAAGSWAPARRLERIFPMEVFR
jgi:putative ABC transport system permease protein